MSGVSGEIRHSTLTAVMGQHQAKILTWYDNEWGFSSRMVDLAKRLGELS